MHPPLASTAAGVPRWIVILGSVAIAFHLTALVVNALDAPSGPWPSMMMGMTQAPAPQFASTLNQDTGLRYLKPLRMLHNYHFLSTNQLSQPEVRMEVRLKKGDETVTLQFPDPNANSFVRYRQAMLMQWLGGDMPYMAPQSERVPAPNTPIEKVEIWDEVGPGKMFLRKKEVLDLPRDRPVPQPSPVCLALVNSYARYLCSQQGADKVEVIRLHKIPIPPDVLQQPNVQSQPFDLGTSNFGELPR
jgi:hypothetical protein